MPGFLRNARARLGYLGSEPDRWHEKSEGALKYAQEPEHSIDLERVEWMSEFPRDRFQFIFLLYEKRATASNPDDLLPDKVGLQPYITIEVYGRLKSAFRQYRQLKKDGKPTGAVEQNIVFYAGWLGHYVADGAQPLHTTVSYDGWVGSNPNGYATARGLHRKFESTFVQQNLKPADFAGLVHAPTRLAHPFQDYVQYLRDSHGWVETLYQLDKAKAFDGAGTPEGKRFVAQRLAAGSQMLVDLWYTAWLESEQP